VQPNLCWPNQEEDLLTLTGAPPRCYKLALKLRNDPAVTQLSKFVHAVGLHFSQSDHNGVHDLKTQVLDFVNIHPESPRAAVIRLKVEKNGSTSSDAQPLLG
jgi:hypothetical protein